MSATRSLILALKADASNFTENIKLAKNETTLMQKEMAVFAEKNSLAKNSLAYMAKELKTSKDAQNILSKQIEMTNNQLKIQIDKYGATSKQAQDYRTKLADLELAQAKLNNTIKNQPAQILKQAGQNIMGVGNKLTMGVTAPIVGGAIGLVTSALKNADEVQVLADKTGLATERIQELRYAATKLDVDLETITGSQAKFTKAMFAATDTKSDQAKSFKALGISVNDTNGVLKDNRDLMFEVFTALGKVESETYRDIIALNLFGRSALELNPLIRAGGEELKTLSQEAYTMGAVMSADKIKALDTLGDSISAMKNSAITAASELAVALIPTVQGLAETVKGALPFINGMIGKFNELSPASKNTVLSVIGITAAVGPMISGLGLTVIGISGLIQALPLIQAFGMGFVQAFNAIRTALIAAKIEQVSFGAAFMASMGPAGWVALGVTVIAGATAAIWGMANATKASEQTARDIVPAIASETMAINNNTAAVDANVSAKLKQIQADAMTAKAQQTTLQSQYDTATYSRMILEKVANDTAQQGDFDWLKKNTPEAYKKISGSWWRADDKYLPENIASAIADQAQVQAKTSNQLNAGYTAQDIANFIADGYTFGGGGGTTATPNPYKGLSAAELAKIMGETNKADKAGANATKQAAAEQEKALNQISSALDTYKSKMDSAVESTLKFVGTFDKFDMKSQSLSSMIRNMGKNFATMRDYYSNMKLLEEKGLARGVLADLYDRGVTAAGDVKRLTGATSEQIATINTTYAGQLELANQIGYRKITSKESVTQYVANINGKSFNDSDLVQKIFELLAGYNIQLAN
jgi:hypothetical protein